MPKKKCSGVKMTKATWPRGPTHGTPVAVAVYDVVHAGRLTPYKSTHDDDDDVLIYF